MELSPQRNSHILDGVVLPVRKRHHFASARAEQLIALTVQVDDGSFPPPGEWTTLHIGPLCIRFKLEA